MDERIAKLLGWYMREDGVWLNSWGAPVTRLPRFSTEKSDSQIVVRHFEVGTFTGEKERIFTSMYKDGMSPMEICQLALLVSGVCDHAD